MPSFETKRIVRHCAANMFDLVADVEQYPKFVPLCESLTVRGRKTLAGGHEVLVADMTVAYKFVRETFTAKVTLERERLKILVEYLDGPVSELENLWTFNPLDENSSEVVFDLSYEFKSKTFASLMGAVFDRAFRKFAAAFEARANEVYGVS